MKQLLLLIALCYQCSFSMAQSNSPADYMAKHAQRTNAESPILRYENTKLAEQELVFFGFIHGSATPQKMDVELLRYLVSKGTKYYAPEVDASLAYFLNRYIQQPNEKLLHFISYYYSNRVPQDASLQFKEKWRKIAELNQSLSMEKRLTILGTDYPIANRYDQRLALTHLAFLAPTTSSENTWVDSLQDYRNFDIQELEIWSGKPALEKAKITKKPMYSYVFPIQSRYNFALRFFDAYQQDSAAILAAFGENSSAAKTILAFKTDLRREPYIFQQFEKQVLPLIAKGEKVYANFGYAHVHQAAINGYSYLAALLKEAYPNLKMETVLGLLARSNALKETKLRKTGHSFTERGLRFEAANYGGYKTAKSYDGHGLFEKVGGTNYLFKAAKGQDIMLIDLTKEDSPFTNSMYFVNYTRGGKKWQLVPNTVTTDYVQYILFMQHSPNNLPFREE